MKRKMTAIITLTIMMVTAMAPFTAEAKITKADVARNSMKVQNERRAEQNRECQKRYEYEKWERDNNYVSPHLRTFEYDGKIYTYREGYYRGWYEGRMRTMHSDDWIWCIGLENFLKKFGTCANH